MDYQVYHSARFDRDLSKFGSYFQEQVDKIEDQLTENPYVGKPLNVRWFREKRLGKYRIYYLIYESYRSVFMVAISEKKDQQQTINTIRLMFDSLKIEIKNLKDDELT